MSSINARREIGRCRWRFESRERIQGELWQGTRGCSERETENVCACCIAASPFSLTLPSTLLLFLAFLRFSCLAVHSCGALRDHLQYTYIHPSAIPFPFPECLRRVAANASRTTGHREKTATVGESQPYETRSWIRSIEKRNATRCSRIERYQATRARGLATVSSRNRRVYLLDSLSLLVYSRSLLLSSYRCFIRVDYYKDSRLKTSQTHLGNDKRRARQRQT